MSPEVLGRELLGEDVRDHKNEKKKGEGTGQRESLRRALDRSLQEGFGAKVKVGVRACVRLCWGFGAKGREEGHPLSAPHLL